MIVPDIEGPFPAGVIRSAVRELRRHNYKPVLFDSDDSAVTEAREVERLTEEGLDGALVIPTGLPENRSVYSQLVRLGYPLVFLDHRPLDVEADYVGTDHFWGAYEATRILIERGHRRIAHFTYMSSRIQSSIQDRRLGYEQALMDNGIEVDPELICPPLVYADKGFVYKHVLFYLRRLPEPVTAVFCLNDGFALASVSAARELGISMPEELEIASYFDGGFEPLMQMPPIIKVIQHQSEIGKAGADLVMSRIEGRGPEGPQNISIRPDIVNELAGDVQEDSNGHNAAGRYGSAAASTMNYSSQLGDY